MQKAFERVVINPLEKPLSSDIDDAQSRLDRTLRELLRRDFAKRTSYTDGSMDGFTPNNGFVADSFKADPTSPVGMTVQLRPGFGFIDNPADVPTALGSTPVVGLDDLCPYKPLVLTVTQQLNIDANPGNGNYRIDLIEAIYDRQLTDAAVRGILNPAQGQFIGTTVNKSLSFTLDSLTGRVVSPANSTAPIGYKVGPVVAGGTTPFSGSVNGPATSPGYIPIAEVIVFGGGTGAGGADITTIIDRHNLRDRRALVFHARMGFIHVRFQVDPTSSTAKPTILDVVGPPGTLVTPVAADAGGGNNKGLVNLYIVPGNLVTVFGARATIVGATPPSSGSTNQVNGFLVNTVPTAFAAATADDAAANGTRSANPFRIAVGQPVILVQLETASLSPVSGTTPAASGGLTNPLTYDVLVNFAY